MAKSGGECDKNVLDDNTKLVSYDEFLSHCLREQCVTLDHTDVKVICSDGFVHAHRAVIAFRCPFWKLVLKDQVMEPLSIVIAPDHKLTDLLTSLEEIYMGSFLESETVFQNSEGSVDDACNDGSMFSSRAAHFEIESGCDSEHTVSRNGISTFAKQETTHSKECKELFSSKTIVCHICQLEVRAANIEDHLFSHKEVKKVGKKAISGGTNKSWERKGNKQGSYVCNFCPVRYIDVNDLRYHVIISHEKPSTDERGRLKCQSCEKYICRGAFRNHFLQVHIDSKDWKYQCDYCEKKLFSKIKKLEHEAFYHTKKKPFTCKACGKGFHSTGSRSTHKRLSCSSNPRPPSSKADGRQKGRLVGPVACGMCQLRFPNESECRWHNMSKHDKLVKNEEGKTRCVLCDRFVLNLRPHFFQVHVDPKEWQFKCDFCELRFVDSIKKLEHESAYHTGATPFSCKGCKKQFPTSARCSWHKRTCELYVKLPKTSGKETNVTRVTQLTVK